MPATEFIAGLFDAYSLIAGLIDAYPKASNTKMIAGLFDAYSLLEIETYKPSSVVTEQTSQRKAEGENHSTVASYRIDIFSHK